MDGDGTPLAFNITPGNTNEQTTLTPTEQKILDDFKLSKFIVCTDAGLASVNNRKFNNKEDRSFITTQSIKQLKKHLKEWALSPIGWKLNEDLKEYDISKLEDSAEEIIKVNKRRWEIEESFRIMKSEFKARPVYLSRDDRITTHFTTCFLSLVFHRYLEKELEEKYTAYEIIDTLRNMNVLKNGTEGYLPSYERTDITDLLHDKFSFRTDYEIVTNKEIKKIFKLLKK